MTNVRQYATHLKYRKFTSVTVNNNAPILINRPPYVGRGTLIIKNATDGTKEFIMFENTGTWVQKQVDTLASKTYIENPQFVDDGTNVKVNPRDLGITDNKELLNYYDEHIRIISNQLVEVSQSLANGQQNPVADILLGVGAGVGTAFPVVGAVTLAVGALVKLFSGDTQAEIIEKTQKVQFLQDLYVYYMPYYNDQKTVMIQEERAKIKNGSGGNNGGNNGGDDNNNLNDTGSNKTLYIIAILLFLFRKKLFK